MSEMAGLRVGTAAAIDDATQQYRKESDTMGRFLKEGCVQGPQHQASGKELYEAYCRWCPVNAKGRSPTTSSLIALVARGIRKKRGRKGTVYQGVGLMPLAVGAKVKRSESEKEERLMCRHVACVVFRKSSLRSLFSGRILRQPTPAYIATHRRQRNCLH